MGTQPDEKLLSLTLQKRHAEFELRFAPARKVMHIADKRFDLGMNVMEDEETGGFDKLRQIVFLVKFSQKGGGSLDKVVRHKNIVGTRLFVGIGAMPHVRRHDEHIAARQYKRSAIDVFKKLTGKDIV